MRDAWLLLAWLLFLLELQPVVAKTSSSPVVAKNSTYTQEEWVPGTMSIVFFALEWPDEARLPQTGAWSYWRFTAELIEKLERPD